MKLRKTEPFGVFDNHNDGIRHINADLDDRCGNEQLDLTRNKA